ncbi:Rho-associated protein kinase [Oopsacas minuta]|uniref:non-specific serine/threonine protein kinase n=1 Tax=Oopsacas minuta TaxID=111878 RepID=A0AAV7KG94_9METZ|nr:Rho-associated protein kinase [Oopsacas minuta]
MACLEAELLSNGDIPTELSSRTRMLEKFVSTPGANLHADALLDSIIALKKDCEFRGAARIASIEKFSNRYAQVCQTVLNCRIAKADFDGIKVIGRGAFGQVQVVRMKENGRVYAMKKMSKFEMMKRSEQACFWEERDIMAFSNSEWIVKLHYAFQDYNFLYMIMEYCPGGDMATLSCQTDFEFTEEACQFYLAEIVLALDAIHKLGYIHRDVKPDNMLIDARGHIKLADFGTCVKVNESGQLWSETAVGTPDYIAPEVLQSQGQGAYYGKECDWWSVGICLYEFIYEETPFYAEGMVETYKNIMDHNNKLSFPGDKIISKEAKEIISQFLTDTSHRLGRLGASHIVSHSFFKNAKWTWESIRDHQAPMIPDLGGDDDTSYFEELDENSVQEPEVFPQTPNFAGNNLPFVGFTYTREKGLLSGVPTSRPSSAAHLLPKREDSVAKAEFELKIINLDVKLKKLQKDYNSEREMRVEIENCKSKLDTKLQIAEVDANVLKKKLDEITKLNQQLKEEHNESTLNTNEIMSSELEAGRLALDKINKDKELLKQELEKLTASESELQSLYSRASSEMIEVKRLNRTINSDLLQAQQVNSALKKDEQQLSHQYEEIQQERDDVTKRLATSEDRYQRQAIELSNLKEELASSLVMNKQAQERCEQLEDRTRATKEDLLSGSDVRQSVLFLELQEKHRVQEREMSKYTVQLDDLRVKLTQRNNELGEIKAKGDRLKEQYDTEKNSRISLLTDYNKLIALNDSLKSMDHGQKERLESMGKHEDKLREENERMKRDLENLSRQNQTITDKVSALNVTNSHLETMLRERSSAETVARENVNIELQLQSVSAKHDEEKKARQEYEQKITMMEREHLQVVLNYKESESRSRTILTEVKSDNARLNEELQKFEEETRMLQLTDQDLSNHINHLNEKLELMEADHDHYKSESVRLSNQLHNERVLKQQAIKKLEEVTATQIFKVPQVRPKGSQDKKLFYENRRLQKELNEEIERRRRIEAKYEGDVIEIQNLLNEEKEQRNRMQSMLREKEEDLKRLREQGVMPFNGPIDSAHSLPVIRARNTKMRTPNSKGKNIKRAHWAVVEVVLSYIERKLQIIHKDTDGRDNLTIEFDSMVYVKYCQMDDTESVRVPEKYQPLCIIITYYKELSEEEITQKEHASGDRPNEFLGHHFVSMPYNTSTSSCDVCAKTIKPRSLFSSNSSVECKSKRYSYLLLLLFTYLFTECKFRCHKEHVDFRLYKDHADGTINMEECPGWREVSHLYLLSENDKQKGDWISLIQAIIVSHARSPSVLKRANTINTTQPYSPSRPALTGPISQSQKKTRSSIVNISGKRPHDQ